MLAAGGGQEKGYRRGTQDVPGALGFAAALAARPYDIEHLRALRRRLEDGARPLGAIVIAEEAARIPTIGAIALAGANNASLLIQLDIAGIAVSAGSACSSGKAKASHVLAAMGVRQDLAAGFLRLSWRFKLPNKPLLDERVRPSQRLRDGEFRSGHRPLSIRDRRAQVLRKGKKRLRQPHRKILSRFRNFRQMFAWVPVASYQLIDSAIMLATLVTHNW
jgi:hypothetical protein